MQLKNKTKLLLLLSAMWASTNSFAQDKSQEAPLLLIGASFANGSMPYFDNLEAPLGGIAINGGRYLSLGNALIRERRLSGHLINEGQAGATTFDRLTCFPGPECVGPGWEGYEKQLTKALSRVKTAQGSYTAKYIVIIRGNDCNHPDAFGIPMAETSECSVEQMHQYTDTFVNVAKRALAAGVTPVFSSPPRYENIEWETLRQRFNWPWIVSKDNYEQFAEIRLNRLKQEVPEALFLDIWRGFTPMDDGLHPDRITMQRAAKRIAKAIKKHQRQQIDTE
ncbi:SGNH/GDSL hydrolase family protein [Pseudoalteromonas luteoviolacea]|uniref:SGNH/GDSL hydrolase family protein n=1 Tax=Pseudoalteromonas luteoviolacea TaxID=43657 RepID=UPI001B394DA3|nr:SGNH/GDSL hydrolase family protein [Pseudoalteromonas luteoviolacea]MBQ4811544.1 SGNH/GDSL hydrolase family protein [Pseudoalteromonas luteoviolacea]